MAQLDIIGTAEPAAIGGATSITATFAALSPGDLIVFFGLMGSNAAIITPPDDVSLIGEGGPLGSAPTTRAWARVVQAGDPLAWTFTTSAPGRLYMRGLRIEGPFTDLSSITATGRQGTAAFETFRVLAANVPVNANTRVLAAVTRPHPANTTPVAYSNGFTVVSTVGWVESLSVGTRLYASAATDVHTEASWTGATGANGLLVRIEAQSAPPPTGALVVAQQPANAWTGEVNRAAIQVRATTNGTTTDTAFTGNVVASVASGSGSVTSGGTVAAVAGVATFPAFVTTGSGDHVLTFTATGYTSVNSATFKVATGTGVPGSGGVIIEETMASKPVQINTTNVTMRLRATNLSDGTPRTDITHLTSGLTVRYRKNDAAWVTVTPLVAKTVGTHTDGGIVHTADGWMDVDIPDVVDTLGTLELTAGGVAGVRFTGSMLHVVAYSPTADNTTALAEATAAASRDDALQMLVDGVTVGDTSMVFKDSAGADVTVTITRAPSPRNDIASTT